MSERDPGLGVGLFGAVVALVTYAVFRLVMEHALRRHGMHPTGLLANDSYYQFAFARELEREGSWLLFHNPYGTLDRSAGLYDGVATALRVLAPFWKHSLFAFDLTVSLLGSAVSGFYFARVAAFVSRQPRAITCVGVVLVIAGSGVGALTHAIGVGPSEVDLGLGASWGLSWVSNQTVVWEIVYHAIFWAGAWSIVRGRRAGAYAAGGALLLLHPFSFAIYVLFALAVAWRPALPLVAAGALGALVYEVLLPAWSHDAEFMRKSYDDQPFNIPTGVVLLFLVPALLFLAVLFLAQRSKAEEGEGRSRFALAMLAFAAILFVISVSYHVANVVPQPAHWTRVYPLAAIVLAALALRPVDPARMRAVLAAVGVIAVVALADSAPVIGVIRDYTIPLGAPVWLDDSQRAVVDKLENEPPGLAIYIRQCDRGYRAELEYSISALTNQRVLYGQFFFSPSLAYRMRLLAACPNQPRPTFPAGTYVVSDPGVARRLPQTQKARLGVYDFGVLR